MKSSRTRRGDAELGKEEEEDIEEERAWTEQR